MRTDGNTANMQHLILQNKVMSDKKYEDIESRITSATGSIPISLQRHERLKRRIKKIHQVKNYGPYFFMNDFHLACENITYLQA